MAAKSGLIPQEGHRPLQERRPQAGGGRPGRGASAGTSARDSGSHFQPESWELRIVQYKQLETRGARNLANPRQ